MNEKHVFSSALVPFDPQPPSPLPVLHENLCRIEKLCGNPLRQVRHPVLVGDHCPYDVTMIGSVSIIGYPAAGAPCGRHHSP